VGLIDDLKPGPVALDTQVFIYFIEEEKRFLPIDCKSFLTNDRRIPAVPGLKILQMKNYL
jgi:hypothetical protein